MLVVLSGLKDLKKGVRDSLYAREIPNDRHNLISVFIFSRPPS